MALENKGLHSQEAALPLEEKSAAPHLSLLVCTSLRFPVKALGDPEDGWKDPGSLGPAVLPIGAPEHQRGRGHNLEVRRLKDAGWTQHGG